MGTRRYTSDDRLDRLALHLGLTTRLLECGAVGVSLKDQLRALAAALDDVVSDQSVKPGALVQREVGVSEQGALPRSRPFRSVEVPLGRAAAG